MAIFADSLPRMPRLRFHALVCLTAALLALVAGTVLTGGTPTLANAADVAETTEQAAPVEVERHDCSGERGQVSTCSLVLATLIEPGALVHPPIETARLSWDDESAGDAGSEAIRRPPRTI